MIRLMTIGCISLFALASGSVNDVDHDSAVKVMSSPLPAPLPLTAR